MANNFIKKYPLDRTAKAVSNRIEDEQHNVGVQFNRIVAPNAGPYYEDSMVVYDTNGNELKKGIDWDPLMPYTEASVTMGIPVTNMLVIKNKDITEVVLKRYQVPGGLYQTYTDAIIDLINSLMQDNRQVMWDDLGGKPIRFQPTAHLHHLKDLYGYEYEVLALEEILRAIQNGDIAAHDVIYQYIENLREWTKDQIAKLQAQVDDLYQQVERLDKRIDGVLADLDVVRKNLAAHIADKNNPHAVTKAQTGLGLVENYAIATTSEAQAGVVTNKYMTPALVAAYAVSKVFPVIQAHIDDKNNPHATTKAQVGLSLVENYPPATQAEGIAGALSNRYMTPLNVAQFMNSNVWPTINNHINNRSNPHGVTKAQVGLGSVDNFPTASVAEANAGGATNRFMTPQLTASLWQTFYNARLATGGNAAVNMNKIVTVASDYATRIGQYLLFQTAAGEVTRLYWDGGSLNCSGNMNVNDVYIRSDIRVKDKVRYLDDTNESMTPKLRNLATGLARYVYNATPDEEELGIIAQVVQEVMPELTVTNQESGIISLKHAGLIAALLKGWSENDERLSKLEQHLGVTA